MDHIKFISFVKPTKKWLGLPAPLPTAGRAPVTTESTVVPWAVSMPYKVTHKGPAGLEQLPVCCAGDVNTVHVQIKQTDAIKSIQLKEWLLGKCYVCGLSPQNAIRLQNLRLSIFIPFPLHMLGLFIAVQSKPHQQILGRIATWGRS